MNGIHNKHAKQRNGGHGNDTRQYVAEIYNLPPPTPYWGLLIELGMQPIECIIHSKRLMLYHNIINTKTKILSKDIIE